MRRAKIAAGTVAVLMGFCTCGRAWGLDWTKEVVEEQVQDAWNTDLAVDGHGYPHVVYATAAGPRYGVNRGAGWQLDDLVGGTKLSLAVTDDGVPHVLQVTNRVVYYNVRSASGWQKEYVESSLNYHGVDIAIDSAGQPHLGWYGIGDNVKYARRGGASWDIVTGPDMSSTGAFAMALDSSDNPHVCWAYIGSYPTKLMYATYDGSSWQSMRVYRTSVGQCWSASIDLDSNDLPRIAHHAADKTYDALLATKSAAGWSVAPIATDGDVGWDISMAIDSEDTVHATYWDRTHNRVMYGRLDDSGGSLETVADNAQDPSIALGDDGTIHIAYYSEVDVTVMHAFAVPEPATLALLGLGGLALVRRRRRRAGRGGWACLVLAGMLAGAVGQAGADPPWTHRTATLSEARYGPATAAAGAKVVIAGGHYCRDAVDIYDSAAGLWTTARLSQARGGLAATAVGSQVLIAGGLWDRPGSPLATSDVVDIYNVQTGEWTTDRLFEARGRLAATTVGTKAIFAGGIGALDDVDIYDAATGQWTTARLSRARGLLAATTVGTKAIFAGGNAGGPVRDDVDIYDDATGQWTTAQLSAPRYDLAATSAGSKAFFAGGWTPGTGPDTLVDIYDADTDQWSVAHLSQGRNHLAAAAVGPYALFAGGHTATGAPSAVVDVYDTRTDTWSVLALSEARGMLGAATLGDTVFFAGGYTGDYSSAVDMFTIPEPATLALLGVAALGLIRRRRRGGRHGHAQERGLGG